MKFLMLVNLDPTRDRSDTDTTGTLSTEEWADKYDATGARVIGGAVQMGADSTSVTRRKGEVKVAAGTYPEVQEWIVGFDVLECADLDEAVRIVAEHPMSVRGRIELRAFDEEDD